MPWSRKKIVFAVTATLLPILLAGFMFGFDIPMRSARFWTLPKGDMAPMTAAWEAFVRQPWRWPLTSVEGLTPQPVSIVFTDSIPWLALLLKATGLASWFTPLGLFLFASYPLQVWSMIALLRALGVSSRGPLLLGGGLALVVPAWIARQFGHIALAGHWIILLALALSVASARQGLTWRKSLGFAALAGLATGVHAYHLVPIAACLIAAVLAELLQRRPDGAWNGVIALGLSGWAVLIGVQALDYQAGLGVTGGAAALGFYSMNLVAPIWPQASLLFGQSWTGEWYKGALDATGGQSFEGLNYLGAGAVALILAMTGAGLWSAIRRRGEGRVAWARWAPLAAAMTVLTLWALGWNVYAFRTHLYDLPKPEGQLAEILGGLRAHGRFFWAAAYLLLAAGVAWAARLPGRWGIGVLAAVLALQAVDTSHLRLGVRQVFAAPDWPAYPRALTDDPRVAGRSWVFAPSYFCSPSQRDLRVIRQMTLAIVRNGGRSNTFPTARSNDAPCGPPRSEISQDAAPGDRRITVVLRNQAPRGGFLQPIAQRSDCYWFGRGVACGRDLEGLNGLRRLRPGEVSAAP